MRLMERFSLSGRDIIVTGATGHLGYAMAWGLAEAGARVLVNSRSEQRSQELVVALSEAGYQAQTAAFDILDELAVQQFFERRGANPLHCLINNAYLGGAGTIETSGQTSYRQSYEISVVAAQRLLQAALPCLRNAVRTSGDASVINVASMYAFVSPDLRVYDAAGTANPPFYGAAKAALMQWTRYAACEFGSEGIRVNSISPGPFPSLSVQKESSAFVSRLADKVPLRRVGNANEIQGAVLLLASQASTFINGADIRVDGGWTAW